jgi:hypothetical protein
MSESQPSLKYRPVKPFGIRGEEPKQVSSPPKDHEVKILKYRPGKPFGCR